MTYDINGIVTAYMLDKEKRSSSAKNPGKYT